MQTRELGVELAKLGVRFLDAPVSGGVKRAVDRTLSIMVGGNTTDLEAARPSFAGWDA
jgi:3-hydroxyisobutyrate dehydrogenase